MALNWVVKKKRIQNSVFFGSAVLKNRWDYSFRDFSRDPQNPLPIRIHILFPYFEGFLWEGSSMGSWSLEYPLIPCRLRAIPNGFGLVSLADLQTDTEPEVKSLIWGSKYPSLQDMTGGWLGKLGIKTIVPQFWMIKIPTSKNIAGLVKFFFFNGRLGLPGKYLPKKKVRMVWWLLVEPFENLGKVWNVQHDNPSCCRSYRKGSFREKHTELSGVGD